MTLSRERIFPPVAYLGSVEEGVCLCWGGLNILGEVGAAAGHCVSVANFRPLTSAGSHAVPFLAWHWPQTKAKETFED